jgi:hypothetical protein
MEKVKMLYRPDEVEVKSVEVHGIRYAQYISGPNVCVVESLERRLRDLVLYERDDKKIVYNLRDCHYTEHEGKLHIEYKSCDINFNN